MTNKRERHTTKELGKGAPVVCLGSEKLIRINATHLATVIDRKRGLPG